jgi:hypothetical protein
MSALLDYQRIKSKGHANEPPAAAATLSMVDFEHWPAGSKAYFSYSDILITATHS